MYSRLVDFIFLRGLKAISEYVTVLFAKWQLESGDRVQYMVTICKVHGEW